MSDRAAGGTPAPAGEDAVLADHPVAARVLASDVVYDGRVWDVRRERFAIDGYEAERDFVDHTGAVAVLAMDDDGRVLLIRQYRHPVRMAELELPAGLLDVAAEPALAAAQRELAEEVDLVASRWDLLCEFMVSPGGSDEMIRVYLARGLSDAPEVFARTEEEAGIERIWTELDAAVEAVLARRAQNSILAIAVLTARLERDRGWSGLGDPNALWMRHPANRGAGAGD